MNSPYTPFLIWLAERCLSTNDTLINEVSREFPKEQVNKLFAKEFDEAYQRVLGASMSMRQTGYGAAVSLSTPVTHFVTWDTFRDYDWVGYLSTAVRRSGIPPHDVDSTVANIVVYLLVQPGKLFSGWNGSTPLEARWKLSVRNAVINARARRKYEQGHSHGSMSDPYVVEPSVVPGGPDEVTQRFKEHVRSKLGERAAMLLQHLLDGGEVKELVKDRTLTSYRAKELVKRLKTELAVFAADDPGFTRRINRVLAKEKETLAKRFGGT